MWKICCRYVLSFIILIYTICIRNNIVHSSLEDECCCIMLRFAVPFLDTITYIVPNSLYLWLDRIILDDFWTLNFWLLNEKKWETEINLLFVRFSIKRIILYDKHQRWYGIQKYHNKKIQCAFEREKWC